MSLDGGGPSKGMKPQRCDIVCHVCQYGDIDRCAKNSVHEERAPVPSGRGVLDDDTAVGDNLHRLPRRADALDMLRFLQQRDQIFVV